MYLWYGTPPTASLADVLAAYQRAVRTGRAPSPDSAASPVGCPTASALRVRCEAAPRRVVLTQGAPLLEVAPGGPAVALPDVRFQLLALYTSRAHPAALLLHPAAATTCALDARLSWSEAHATPGEGREGR